MTGCFGLSDAGAPLPTCSSAHPRSILLYRIGREYVRERNISGPIKPHSAAGRPVTSASWTTSSLLRAALLFRKRWSRWNIAPTDPPDTELIKPIEFAND